LRFKGKAGGAGGAGWSRISSIRCLRAVRSVRFTLWRLSMGRCGATFSTSLQAASSGAEVTSESFMPLGTPRRASHACSNAAAGDVDNTVECAAVLDDCGGVVPLVAATTGTSGFIGGSSGGRLGGRCTVLGIDTVVGEWE
jgi:hypothetical protein